MQVHLIISQGNSHGADTSTHAPVEESPLGFMKGDLYLPMATKLLKWR